MLGNKTFVSYYEGEGVDTSMLPKIKKGIYTPLENFKKAELNPELAQRINLMYAKDYRVTQDMNIIVKSWRK